MTDKPKTVGRMRDAILNILPPFQQGYISREDIADEIISALPVAPDPRVAELQDIIAEKDAIISAIHKHYKGLDEPPMTGREKEPLFVKGGDT